MSLKDELKSIPTMALVDEIYTMAEAFPLLGPLAYALGAIKEIERRAKTIPEDDLHAEILIDTLFEQAGDYLEECEDKAEAMALEEGEDDDCWAFPECGCNVDCAGLGYEEDEEPCIGDQDYDLRQSDPGDETDDLVDVRGDVAETAMDVSKEIAERLVGMGSVGIGHSTKNPGVFTITFLDGI